MLLLKVLLALAPWMVVFSSLVPDNTRTVTALLIGVVLLAVAAPLRFRNALGPIAATVFAVTILGKLVFAESLDDVKQGIGFLVFPAAALAVLSERGRELLPQVRNVAVYSGLFALTAHLVVIGLGMGRADDKYGAGEKLGFVAEEPHEMALLGVVIAAAGLMMSEKVLVRSVFFGIGALPALFSGVRSALVGIILVLIVMLVESRLSARSLAVLGVATVVGIAGGVQAVLAERLESTFGEGVSVDESSAIRTVIWQAAVGAWLDSGWGGWLFGIGLTAIPQAVYRELGLTYVGHSDVIEIGVQVGLFALVAWGLLWLALFRGGLRPIVFLPVVVYAVINGAIGYAIPLTLALVLGAALRVPDSAKAAAPP
jgi:O-antigen ligase